MSEKKQTELAKVIDDITSNEGAEAAVAYLNHILTKSQSAEAYYIRGRLKWKLGRRSEAMADYSAAVAIDPQSDAATALSMARDVMDFFNPDLYNP